MLTSWLIVMYFQHQENNDLPTTFENYNLLTVNGASVLFSRLP